MEKSKRKKLILGLDKCIIEDVSKFKSSEVPTRYMSSPATGKFGTSSYKPHQLSTRMVYVNTFYDDADKYINIINSIISNEQAEIKFECDNSDMLLSIDDKEVKKMKSILAIYEYVK